MDTNERDALTLKVHPVVDRPRSVGRIGKKRVPWQTWAIAVIGLVLGAVFVALDNTVIKGYESVPLMGYSGFALSLCAFLHAHLISQEESRLNARYLQTQRRRRTTMRFEERVDYNKRKSRIN